MIFMITLQFYLETPLNKKMKIDLVQSTSVLKITSTICSGLFAGGALYITMVEQPARMTHDPVSAITQWKPTFVRAASLQVFMLYF